MKYVIISIVIYFFSNCTSNHSKKEIIVVEEEELSGSISYAKVGKLKLSEYGLFKQPISKLEPRDNIFNYELNTPLFTDYAQKKRFVFIPGGKSAMYHDREVFDFPIGTILIKNFYYSDQQIVNGEGRLIETRLLVHEEAGWKALPYIWNKEQTEAFLEITGGNQEIKLLNKSSFRYNIPSMAQCKSCHEFKGEIAPIGPNARQLNKSIHEKNQLLIMSEAGLLSGLPDLKEVDKLAVWDDYMSESIDNRARAYLEINCGHCHRPEGPGKNSGLDLTIFSTLDHSLGVFKGPVAAGAGSGGLSYDIVPGKPDESILVYRMESSDPGVMMPELGRRLIHSEGVDLIKNWIKSMK